MNSTYRIVVGVDGSAGARQALIWAIREAAQRGGTVQAVAAWHWDGQISIPIADATPQDARLRAERMLAQEIEAVAHLPGPATPVAAEVVQGSPAPVLTRAAATADLLVLGSHGHGRLRHAVLGSVSEECVRHAPCPVVIIPTPATTAPAAAEAYEPVPVG